MPERAMESTKYHSGGAVQHEILIVRGTLLLVIETKTECTEVDELAQLFLELLCESLF